MTRIKRILTTIAVALGLSMPIAMPAVVSAQDIQGNLCSGASLSTTETDCAAATANAGTEVDEIITDVINIFSLVVGVVSVIMIIIGGFKYITSSGDTGNVTSAKNTIMFAVVGLVVVALAQVIVTFVIDKVS